MQILHVLSRSGKGVHPGYRLGLFLMLATLALPGLAQADGLDSGDTAWMLTSTALVLFMTIPGLSLFYGGLVRAKNVLSVLMQCFALTGLITVLWILYGYSLAFDTTGMQAGVTNFHSFVGGLGKAFARGISLDSLSGSIPETVFVTFQLTFAIITPALIAGAFAERMKFSAMLLFMAIWFTVVYAPICHMAWSGDGAFFGDRGVLDFGRRHSGAHQCGYRWSGGGPGHRQAPGVSRGSHTSSQLDLDRGRRFHALGRLVRL